MTFSESNGDGRGIFEFSGVGFFICWHDGEAVGSFKNININVTGEKFGWRINDLPAVCVCVSRNSHKHAKERVKRV